MTILGPVVTFYQTSPDAAAVSLRALLGPNFYSDILPTNPPTSRPFMAVEEISRKLFGERKSQGERAKILDVTVSFLIYTNDRNTAETILDLAESTFLETDLTLDLADPYQHLAGGIFFENRRSYFDTANGWIGSLDLRYRITKN